MGNGPLIRGGVLFHIEHKCDKIEPPGTMALDGGEYGLGRAINWKEEKHEYRTKRKFTKPNPH